MKTESFATPADLTLPLTAKVTKQNDLEMIRRAVALVEHGPTGEHWMVSILTIPDLDVFTNRDFNNHTQETAQHFVRTWGANDTDEYELYATGYDVQRLMALLFVYNCDEIWIADSYNETEETGFVKTRYSHLAELMAWKPTVEQVKIPTGK